MDAVRGKNLTAIDNPAVIGAFGPSANGGGIGASLWLGDGKSADHVAFEGRHQVFLFLLFGAILEQHMRGG